VYLYNKVDLGLILGFDFDVKLILILIESVHAFREAVVGGLPPIEPISVISNRSHHLCDS
jgi:hypothetical protein